MGRKMEALEFNLFNPLVVKYWYFFFAMTGNMRTVATTVSGSEDLKLTSKNENIDD